MAKKTEALFEGIEQDTIRTIEVRVSRKDTVAVKITDVAPK